MIVHEGEATVPVRVRALQTLLLDVPDITKNWGLILIRVSRATFTFKALLLLFHKDYLGQLAKQGMYLFTPNICIYMTRPLLRMNE